jgi:hypothetical protein
MSHRKRHQLKSHTRDHFEQEENHQVPKKRSLGKLRKNKKTKPQSPDATGKLHFQRHTLREIYGLQQQLQNVVSDLAALQRLVEQVARKQEQISRDMMPLQAAEQNLNAKISSLTQPAAVRVAPRRNIAKLVHSEAPKPTAESLPLQRPAPETPSPADQPPRPPLPLSAPPMEASSSAH